ncbi:UNC-like C-terminal-domain-containing protein [Phaeosphaeriaceae sp. PMI808]|nr:UNC-like C-terminal-domain-containing protein [Phaeosphaeriaceae sp. PMI808]
MGVTPRRSARISQAGSVTNQSVVTTMTTGGTRQRKKGPLTKVKARKSNAYGASGRVGAAEELSVSTTGFAQAFQNQRGDAVTRDDSDDDDTDELGAETPRMSGALDGHVLRLSPSTAPGTSSRVAPSFSFEDSEGITPSENDMSVSIGNTSKSFGLVHEAGMLFRPLRPESSHPSSDDNEDEFDYEKPLWLKNKTRRLQTHAKTQEHDKIDVDLQASQKRPFQASPAAKAAIQQSVDDLIAEEHARQQRGSVHQHQASPHVPAATQVRKDPRTVNEWLGNLDAGRKHEHGWTWKRVTTYVAGALLALLVLSQLLHQLMPTESASRAGMPTAIGTRIVRSWYDLTDWVMLAGTKKETNLVEEFKIGDGSKDDNAIWSRMRKLYNEFDGRIGEMHDTIAELNNHLPEFMVVRRHPDGRQEVTDEFWNALISKANTSGGNAEWTAFLKNNEEKLRGIFGVPRPVDDSLTRPEAVSRDEFVRLMQERYKTIATRIDQKIDETVKSQAAQIKSIAQVEAKKAIINSIRLDSLAKGNLIANYELTLLKPNYFSLGLGARIDPTLTSATFLNNPHFFANAARKLALVPPRNPPKVALEKWEEPGDCWCAAPNPVNGQAQLAVTVARPLFPTQVTIEHVPMSMMPAKKVTTAPRNIELWVETDQPAHYQYAHRDGVCQNGPAGWTCLGSFTYNIHGSNHRQTFDLDARSSVPVIKAMLRVTSNWGANHTCLYRVRLHGKDAKEDHQYEA